LFRIADTFDRTANPAPFAGKLIPRGPGHRGLSPEPTPEELAYEAARQRERSVIDRLLDIDHEPDPSD
jgi:hypothetical protein